MKTEEFLIQQKSITNKIKELEKEYSLLKKEYLNSCPFKIDTVITNVYGLEFCIKKIKTISSGEICFGVSHKNKNGSWSKDVNSYCYYKFNLDGKTYNYPYIIE